jgi:hypothetical protein
MSIDDGTDGPGRTVETDDVDELRRERDEWSPRSRASSTAVAVAAGCGP